MQHSFIEYKHSKTYSLIKSSLVQYDHCKTYSPLWWNTNTEELPAFFGGIRSGTYSILRGKKWNIKQSMVEHRHRGAHILPKWNTVAKEHRYSVKIRCSRIWCLLCWNTNRKTLNFLGTQTEWHRALKMLNKKWDGMQSRPRASTA